jgi:hypothetical protein
LYLDASFAPRMEQAASHSHCSIDLSVLLSIGFLIKD